MRNRQELNASLKGTTLGDADDDVDDTLKWIKRNKRKERDLALKRQQEFENRDREVLADYTERECSSLNSNSDFLIGMTGVTGDLEGLKVTHDFDAMDEGESRILTLKDSRILDNEGKGDSLLVIFSLTSPRGRTSECRDG